MRPRRAGFTLIELAIALSIGAVLLLGARTLLDGLSDQAQRTARWTRESDARIGARRTAEQVVGNMALAPNQQRSFIGTPDEATFDSWCPAPRSGLAPCSVRLRVQNHRPECAVVLSSSTGDDDTLGHGAACDLRYLSDAADGGQWEHEWNELVGVPLAIGVVAGSDTMLLRVGERR